MNASRDKLVKSMTASLTSIQAEQLAEDKRAEDLHKSKLQALLSNGDYKLNANTVETVEKQVNHTASHTASHTDIVKTYSKQDLNKLALAVGHDIEELLEDTNSIDRDTLKALIAGNRFDVNAIHKRLNSK